MRTMNSRKLGILLFAGLMAGGTAARADDASLGGQFEDWTVLRAFGTGTSENDGKVSSLAVAPSRPSRVMATVGYAAYGHGNGDGGLYRSDNAGADWTVVNVSRPLISVTIHPSDPNLVMGGSPPG
jgi:hypothetical protein